MPELTGSIAAKRAGVLAGCALLAGLSLLSALDRMASVSRRAAELVPVPFAAASLLSQGTAALDGRDYAKAETLAQAAIRAAPIEPESAALLGAARLGKGDAAGAQAAFLVAGRFGWRTPITQYYWMSEALAVGDYRVAAMRLDAMLRQQPQLVSSRELMAPMESSAAGRGALAERLVPGPAWLEPYAGAVFELSPEVVHLRADVLDDLARAGRPVGCVRAGPLTTALVSAGDMPRAAAMWRAQCPERGHGLIADADFAGLQVHAARSPFDWVVIGDSDVSLSLAPDGKGAGRYLVLASSASFPRKVLTQLVLLQPGAYRLSWAARTEAGSPTTRVVPTVSCDADSRDWLSARYDEPARRYVADFTVDATCAGRWVSFAILPGTESLALANIALEPLR